MTFDPYCDAISTDRDVMIRAALKEFLAKCKDLEFDGLIIWKAQNGEGINQNCTEMTPKNYFSMIDSGFFQTTTGNFRLIPVLGKDVKEIGKILEGYYAEAEGEEWKKE